MDRKMHAGATKFHYQRARELRNNATHAETILWGYLKTKPLGIKFRRQHPYSIYILDLYCHSLKLVIEVDSDVHSKSDVKLNDEERQNILEKDGLCVMRFTNEQVKPSLIDIQLEIEKFIQKNNDER